MAEVVRFGSWPILDKLLKEAENDPGFTNNLRAQARLIFHLGDPKVGYWMAGAAHQQEVLSRLLNLIPRLQVSKPPKPVLEALFKLHLTSEPFEAISRALKVVTFEPRPLLPEEQLYPTEGFIGSFLAWTQESDVPLGFYFWAAVATIAAACRYNFFIDRGTDNLRLNQYLVFVGTKATGKSTALNATLEVLSHLNSQVWEWQPTSGVLPPLHHDHPFHVRMLPEDTNQETLVRLLAPKRMSMTLADGAEHEVRVESTGLLALDELATFLGRDTWAISKRVPFLTRLYADKRYTYQTQKGGTITLTDCALSLLACCTPDWMRDAISPLMFGGGFMDRTLLIYREPLPPPPLFPTARPRDPLAAAKLAEFLKPLTARLRREEMTATHEAEQWYDAWYSRQEESPDPNETSVKRKANHLWKLAATLSLGDHSAPYIKAHHFETADRIFNHEWRQFRALMGIMEEAPEASHMSYLENLLYRHDAIEGLTPGYMMKSELFQFIKSRKGLSPPTVKAAPILESLAEAGRINHIKGVSRTNKKGVRSGEAFQLTKAAVTEMEARNRRPGRKPKLVLPAPPIVEEPDVTPEDEVESGA